MLVKVSKSKSLPRQPQAVRPHVLQVVRPLEEEVQGHLKLSQKLPRQPQAVRPHVLQVVQHLEEDHQVDLVPHKRVPKQLQVVQGQVLQVVQGQALQIDLHLGLVPQAVQALEAVQLQVVREAPLHVVVQVVAGVLQDEIDNIYSNNQFEITPMVLL